MYCFVFYKIKKYSIRSTCIQSIQMNVHKKLKGRILITFTRLIMSILENLQLSKLLQCLQWMKTRSCGLLCRDAISKTIKLFLASLNKYILSGVNAAFFHCLEEKHERCSYLSRKPSLSASMFWYSKHCCSVFLIITNSEAINLRASAV